MVFFSSLKNLFSRKDKKTLNTSNLRNIAKKKALTCSDSQQNSKNSTAVNSPVNSVTNNSCSGYNFQFKDGRRYHADSDVAYILPNDDDGNS
jgi:hypothetical protein